MSKYHFRYRENGNDLHVIIESKSMNKAMIHFAKNYSKIEHVYGIFKLPI